jgi:hypothetical protein
MYRQGLGDCFLLAFATANKADPVYLLIDCGVHPQQPLGQDVMDRVLDDIVQATGGRLHVVIATHEHVDHLSMFVQRADRFLSGELTIDRLWLAWTEDPSDPLARELRRSRSGAKQAVEAALKQLKQKAPASRAALALGPRLEAAVSFFEMEADQVEERRAALAARLGLDEPGKVTAGELALAVLQDRVSRPDYLRPGQGPIPIPGAESCRAYVLGPPRDPKLLSPSDSSGGDRHETYLASAVGFASFAMANCSPADEREWAQRELCFPFDARHRRNFQETEAKEFFRQTYGLDPKDPSHSWRRIDADWLFAAEELALHLDRHANNASLALAFELGPVGEGPVLLFAGDAQAGSWLSWRSLQWQAAGRAVDVKDLLRRTRVYKVGHHASPNGTLQRDDQGADYGLALIPDGVIALVPVDQAAAEKLPGWRMPFGRLYAALKAKSRGNILRSDEGRDPELPVPRTRAGGVPGQPGAQWRRSTAQKSGGGPLYYDVALSVGR